MIYEMCSRLSPRAVTSAVDRTPFCVVVVVEPELTHHGAHTTQELVQEDTGRGVPSVHGSSIPWRDHHRELSGDAMGGSRGTRGSTVKLMILLDGLVFL